VIRSKVNSVSLAFLSRKSVGYIRKVCWVIQVSDRQSALITAVALAEIHPGLFEMNTA